MVSPEVQLIIQEFKEAGKTKKEVLEAIKEMNHKVPSETTLRRYYNRSPEEGILEGKPRDKKFDQEPYKSCIIEILRNNSDPCVSSIYDVLVEKFVETKQVEKLPASLRSLQNYVNYLKKNNIVDATPKEGRIYDHVFDTPPGDQLLIDFGDFNLGDRIHYFFICLLLRYSRFLTVYGQDHKYNSEEACRDIYRCFMKLGGRPKYLVIDQDAVFINSETYGEVIKTQVFEGFCREQELELFVCRKADPESKGPIENSVREVKRSYLSARSKETVQELNTGLPSWLERRNDKIHRSIYQIPKDVFTKFERNSLRPLLPSNYNSSPRSFTELDLTNYPYVTYKSNKYYYPSEFAFKKVYYRVIDNKIYLYDASRKLVTSYPVSPQKGKSFQHEGFSKKPTKYLSTIEHMRSKWNCDDFQHFVNGVKKEAKGRYLDARFDAISSFLDSKDPDPRFAAKVLKYCCKHFRYTPYQFMDSYKLLEESCGSDDLVEPYPYTSDRGMEVYQRIFNERAGVKAESAVDPLSEGTDKNIESPEKHSAPQDSHAE